MEAGRRLTPLLVAVASLLLAAGDPARADDPGGFDDLGGSLLLTTGVTTMVAQHEDPDRLNVLWSGKETPGPRLLDTAKFPVEPVFAFADSMTPGLPALLESRQARLIGVG